MDNYYQGEVKKLGFGLMRLPKKGLGINIDETAQMVDEFLDAGFTYFDTAFVYPGSEDAARKALVDRKPRDSYSLATKLYAAMMPTAKMAKGQFETSLKRTNAKYFDYYLLHSLMGNNYEKYAKLGIWEFVEEKKKEGLVKKYGFSFHDGPELLDRILTEHPDVDFVQLQINYADWENKKVTSRANYEVARNHGKQIVVMEPVKGGNLATPPKDAEKLFKEYNPNASNASWAIRFVASLDGILTVLSGMSNLEQMRDNLSYMKDFRPLNDDEQKIIAKAQAIIGNSAAIPCTSCRYCIEGKSEGCPKNIAIPDIFAAMNKHLAAGQTKDAVAAYRAATKDGGNASDCIKCKQCEKACPQHIIITEHLEKCASLLEKVS